MNRYEHVLSPFKFGNVTVKNRIELAPACHMLSTHDGFVTREMIEYYENLAKGGAGIITVGESPINYGLARDHEFQLNLGTDLVINGLNVLNEAVSKYGAKISIEINHSGRFTLNNRDTIGPSPIHTPLEEALSKSQGRKKNKVVEMDQDMIDLAIEEYANAVYRCYRAGFEMVMLHGGHGHLISQFLSPISNKRTDNYGGSLENRAKFSIEVLDAIRKKVGNKVAIEFRISGNEMVEGGMDEIENIKFVKMIEDKIDLLHVSAGILGDNRTVPDMIQPCYLPHCYNVHRAEKMKQALRVPITTVGSINSMEMAEDIIASGKADIVAMARGIFADPNIVNNALLGQAEETRPCLRCFNCNRLTRHFYPIRCSVNPVLGREIKYAEIAPALSKKKIVIVGGGPAGMQAALTASLRGHETVLFEKGPSLGGNLVYPSQHEFKTDLKRYLEWLVRQTLNAPGVTVKLNTSADAEIVRRENPDVLILSIGAKPIMPEFPGASKNNVVWVGDACLGKAKVGKDILIIGASSSGSELGLALAREGKKVTTVDIRDYAALADEWDRGLNYQLEQYSVNTITETRLEEITEKGAVVLDAKTLRRYEIQADTIILSLGFKATPELVDRFEGSAKCIYSIGDCTKPGRIKDAVHAGFNTVMGL